MKRFWLILLVSLSLAGCSSPFIERPGSPYAPESADAPASPTATTPVVRVGQGVRAWPLLEVDRWGEGRQVDVLWPVFQQIRWPQGWKFRLFPLLFLSRADEADYTWVFPFYGHQIEKEDGERLTNALFPFFWHFSKADSPYWKFVAFPFVWVMRDTEDRRFTWVWPLYGESQDGDERIHRYLWPLIRHKTSDEGWKFRAAPVLFLSRSAEDEYTCVFPFYGEWIDKGDDGGADGAPSSPDGYQNRLTSVLFPIFWHYTESGTDRRNFVAFPFVWRMRENEEHYSTWVWPLYGKSRAGDERARHLLWPIVRQKTWDGGWDFRAAPLVWLQRTDNGADDYTHVWPFYGSSRKDGVDSEYYLWPFVQRESWHDGWKFAAFPFLWLKRQDDGRYYTHFWPFYGQWRKYDGSEKRYFPYPINFYESGDHGWSYTLFPFLWLKRTNDQEDEYTHVFPFFGKWEDGEEKGRYYAAGLFQHKRTPDVFDLWSPWPLVNVHREEGFNKDKVFLLYRREWGADWKSGRILGPLVQWDRREDRSHFRVLVKWIENLERPDRSYFAFRPFYFHETNAQGDDHKAWFFDLFARTTEDGETKTRLFWFWDF